MGLEFLFGFVVGMALCAGVSGLVMPLRASSLSESTLLETLISKRADRYIAAVAKQTTENEVEIKSRNEATQRLAIHGVKPTVTDSGNAN